MGESAGNIKLRVPWTVDEPVTAPPMPVWGGLDAVNRQYVRALFAQAGGLVFIGPNPPPNPLPGLLWWRNDPDGDLYIYYDDGNSAQWVPAVSSSGGGGITPPPLVTVADAPPANPQVGQMWYSNAHGLCLYYSAQWIQV